MEASNIILHDYTVIRVYLHQPFLIPFTPTTHVFQLQPALPQQSFTCTLYCITHEVRPSVTVHTVIGDSLVTSSGYQKKQDPERPAALHLLLYRRYKRGVAHHFVQKHHNPIGPHLITPLYPKTYHSKEAYIAYTY